MRDREGYKLLRAAKVPPPRATTFGKISNLSLVSNGTSISYTITLGKWDMTSNGTTGGSWSNLSNTTYKAFPDKLHAAPIAIGETVSLAGRGSDGNGTIYFTIVGAPSVALVTISASPSNATSNTSLYNVTVSGNITMQAHNGFESIVGSPGTLGVAAAANGTISNGTCVGQPLGVGAQVWLGWDYKNSRWSISAPNSAQ